VKKTCKNLNVEKKDCEYNDVIDSKETPSPDQARSYQAMLWYSLDQHLSYPSLPSISNYSLDSSLLFEHIF